MFSQTTRQLLYRTFVLLVVVSFNDGNSAEKTSCQASREQNTIVNIKASNLKSNTSRVVEGLNLHNESLCLQRCCSHANCTLYVYYESPNRPSNCFLIKCTPTSNCVRSSLEDSVVGVLEVERIIVERNNLIQATPLSTSHADQLHTVSTVTSKDGVMLETTLSETPMGSTSSSVQQPQQKGEENNRSAPHSITATAQATIDHNSSATQTQPTSHGTTPQVKIQNKKKKAEGPEHTNKTSLIIALFFGILFLLAILVIVGRPWWDFMHRPRYSKVDYLMNGI